MAVRLFLSGFEQLTPTFRNINNKFSVKCLPPDQNPRACLPKASSTFL